MSSLRYLKSHETVPWPLAVGDEAKICITDHAQDSLGEIVYLELPEVGDSFSPGEQFGEIETEQKMGGL